MWRFNKKTEYALLAINHMAGKGEKELTTAREIAEAYDISFALVAKILQELSSNNYIRAIQGTKGGYRLEKLPAEIKVSDVIEIFDGPLGVVECFQHKGDKCPRWGTCNMKNPFSYLNSRIANLLKETTMADLVGGDRSRSDLSS